LAEEEAAGCGEQGCDGGRMEGEEEEEEEEGKTQGTWFLVSGFRGGFRGFRGFQG